MKSLTVATLSTSSMFGQPVPATRVAGTVMSQELLSFVFQPAKDAWRLIISHVPIATKRCPLLPEELKKLSVTDAAKAIKAFPLVCHQSMQTRSADFK